MGRCHDRGDRASMIVEGNREMKLLSALLGLSLFFSNSCRSPNSSTPLRAPNLQSPVTTGIFITRESGPEPLGTFGNPNPNGRGTLECDFEAPDGGAIPSDLTLTPPFPNPFNPQATIRFSLPCPGSVAVYVVPARFLNQHGQIVQFSNATISIPGGLAVAVLIDREAPPGSYSVFWDGRDQNGRLVSDGFYRIYLAIDDQLLWQDILLLTNPCNAPTGFEIFAGERGCF